MSYIQKSKVRGLVKAAGMNIAADVNDAVDQVVCAAVDKAVTKAKEAGRKTLKGQDFDVAVRHDTGKVPPMDDPKPAEDAPAEVPVEEQSEKPPLEPGKNVDGTDHQEDAPAEQPGEAPDDPPAEEG